MAFKHTIHVCMTAHLERVHNFCGGPAGGMAEYEGVRDYMAELDSYSWVSTETHLLNRESAPRLLLSHRLPGKCSSAQWRPVLALVKGADIGPVYEN